MRVGDGTAKPITLNDGKTTIGRGPLLQVTDKRVSRNHGILEVSDGKLYLTPTHTNPCFFKKSANSSVEILKKDERRLLENGQIFGLLPDSLYFKVQCPVTQNGTGKSKTTDVEEENSEEETKDEETTPSKSRPWERIVTPDGKKEMALPLEKKRVLPAWMVTMAKSPPPGAKASPVKQIAKTPTKRKTEDSYSTAKKTPSRRRKTESEEDEDFDIEEEEKMTTKRGRGTTKKRYADVSEEDDEDWEAEEEYKPKKRSPAKSRPTPKAKPKPRRRARDSSEEVSEEEIPRKKRGGKSRGRRDSSEDEKPSTSSRSMRAARTKRKSYVDDFVDFSDEDDFLPPGSQSKDEDSDFVLDENDESGSDWEMEAKSSQKKSRGTPSRRSSRTVGRRRKYTDSDEEESSEDDYRPPSKKRQSPSKRSGRGRRKAPSSDESESSSDDYVAPKRDPKTKKRKEESSSEEEEEDDEEETPKKKTASRKNKHDDSESEKKDKRDDVKKVRQLKSKHRPPCMFGKKCYRKNPEHFAEFSHPGDVSYDEQSDLDEEDEKPDCPYGNNCYRTNVSHLKQYRHYTRERDTKLTMPLKTDDKSKNGEEESQGPNTYDYNDSFINDESQAKEEEEEEEDASGGEDGEAASSEEEDIKQLKKEAKQFVKNEKMVKPV